MGANESRPPTTSPIPQYGYVAQPQHGYNAGPQPQHGYNAGPQPQQGYSAGPQPQQVYSAGPQAQHCPPTRQLRGPNPYSQACGPGGPFDQGDEFPPNGRYGQVDPRGGPPRGPPRGYGPGRPGGPGGPPGPPRGGNNFARSSRPLPPSIGRMLDDDDDDIFAVEQDLFRARPRQKQSPFADFDPFENYARRRRGDDGPSASAGGQQGGYDQQGGYGQQGGHGGIVPQREPQYAAKPQFYHIQPPADQPSTHVFRYDPNSGTLAMDGSQSQGGYPVEAIQLPPSYDYSGQPGPQVMSIPQVGQPFVLPQAGGQPIVLPQQYQGFSQSYGIPGQGGVSW